MTPTDAQFHSLLDLCASVDFVHRAEIVSLLTNPEARVTVHEVGAGHDLETTYRTRAAILTKQERDGTLTLPSESGRRMPATLAEDVRRVSVALDAADHQPVHIWSIVLADCTCYILFVLVRDRSIAGAVKSVIERKA